MIIGIGNLTALQQDCLARLAKTAGRRDRHRIRVGAGSYALVTIRMLEARGLVDWNGSALELTPAGRALAAP